jgi:2-keto-3-deoxy-L-fuconate dehydrogenase
MSLNHDMNRLKGKIADHTAAGQGIGRATAEAFIVEGATVIATDLKLELLQGLACRTEKLDVLDFPKQGLKLFIPC